MTMALVLANVVVQNIERTPLALVDGLAQLEDANKHLPRQSRLQGRQYPDRGRKPAAAGAGAAGAA